MKVVAFYDFNQGKDFIENNYSNEYQEVLNVIHNIDSSIYKTKESEEKTMVGKMLFSPSELNKAFKSEFGNYGWSHYKIECDYSYGEFTEEYIKPKDSKIKPFRDMDFIKENKRLGIEVQFGKYAFMVYNVCAKMTIFKNQGIIDAGIEIVPVKNFADDMSTGVSYFEQFAWDLTQRGISNIDIPVLILGIDA